MYMYVGAVVVVPNNSTCVREGYLAQRLYSALLTECARLHGRSVAPRAVGRTTLSPPAGVPGNQQHGAGADLVQLASWGAPPLERGTMRGSKLDLHVDMPDARAIPAPICSPGAPPLRTADAWGEASSVWFVLSLE